MELLLGNLDKITNIVVLLFSSLFIRLLMEVVGQSWIKTIAHTSTLLILPILTYIITSVISGNIALSLGMVGALSIVRFRNPVRSPLELSVYFGAITMGITASVDMNWLFLLLASMILISVLMLLISKIADKFFNTPFFITSFSEGLQLSTLEVEASDILKILENSPYLMSKLSSNGLISYSLSSINFDVLKNIEKDLSSFKEVTSIQLSR